MNQKLLIQMNPTREMNRRQSYHHHRRRHRRHHHRHHQSLKRKFHYHRRRRHRRHHHRRRQSPKPIFRYYRSSFRLRFLLLTSFLKLLATLGPIHIDPKNLRRQLRWSLQAAVRNC